MKGADLVAASKKEPEEKQENLLANCSPTRKYFVSTGSTLLNLACTDHPSMGFRKGTMVLVPGVSSAGKTFGVLTVFAECQLNQHFKKHRLIYDDTEGGNSINMEKFFGKAVADKIEAPTEGCSQTVEQFYYSLDDALDQGDPFIYVLDSMDGLSSDSDDSKFDDMKKADRAGKDTTGTFGVGKAKANSTLLRTAMNRLKDSESILIIICQSRDNISPMSFEKETRAGGRALKFYAHVEMWLSIKQKIAKTVKGKKRHVGNDVLFKIKKNRLNGYCSDVVVPILPSVGMDDVSANVDYLIDEGVWKKSGQKVTAIDLDFQGTRDALIKKIEDEDLEDKVAKIVGDTWNAIKEAMAGKRKRRYS